MSAVSVNGVAIDAQAVAAEAQNHPAASPDTAVAEATRALVIRELLLQQARREGIRPEPQIDEKGRRETDDDAMIRQLLDVQIATPEADSETCRRYYENNRHRFRSPALFEPSHILLAASPGDADAYAAAIAEAARLIAELQHRPEAFEALARDRSDCSSGTSGGRLGQMTLRDVVPEFATFLDNLEEGQLCPVPVKTRYGAHVLRLDRRVDGRELPFDAVTDRIADYLHEASWRRAVAQYIRLLAGQAAIEGVDLEGASSPLVQ